MSAATAGQVRSPPWLEPPAAILDGRPFRLASQPRAWTASTIDRVVFGRERKARAVKMTARASQTANDEGVVGVASRCVTLSAPTATVAQASVASPAVSNSNPALAIDIKGRPSPGVSPGNTARGASIQRSRSGRLGQQSRFGVRDWRYDARASPASTR